MRQTGAGELHQPAGVETNMVYNKDYHAYQFCDGTNWKSMGSAHAFGSGGCSNPAGVEKAIIYNTDFHTYQFCNGTSWAKMQGG